MNEIFIGGSLLERDRQPAREEQCMDAKPLKEVIEAATREISDAFSQAKEKALVETAN